MTTKIYSAKSSAARALKKAISGYEAFVVESWAEEAAEGGFCGMISLKSGAGRHLQEYFEERGMIANLMPAIMADADLAEERAAAQPMGEKDLPPAEAAEDDEETEASEEEIADYLSGQFALMFMNAGGNNPRGRCKALRAVAAVWDGSRKEFIAAAVSNGIMPGTANANYQAGYKG